MKDTVMPHHPTDVSPLLHLLCCEMCSLIKNSAARNGVMEDKANPYVECVSIPIGGICLPFMTEEVRRYQHTTGGWLVPQGMVQCQELTVTPHIWKIRHLSGSVSAVSVIPGPCC